jgi:hypothetical protein
LSSEEELDTESIGGHFLPIFAKMKNTELDTESIGGHFLPIFAKMKNTEPDAEPVGDALSVIVSNYSQQKETADVWGPIILIMPLVYTLGLFGISIAPRVLYLAW